MPAFVRASLAALLAVAVMDDTAPAHRRECPQWIVDLLELGTKKLWRAHTAAVRTKFQGEKGDHFRIQVPITVADLVAHMLARMFFAIRPMHVRVFMWGSSSLRASAQSPMVICRSEGFDGRPYPCTHTCTCPRRCPPIVDAHTCTHACARAHTRKRAPAHTHTHPRASFGDIEVSGQPELT